jgi:hypothetical protein
MMEQENIYLVFNSNGLYVKIEMEKKRKKFLAYAG